MPVNNIWLFHNTLLKTALLFSVSGIKQSCHERIQQFVSAVTVSRLGGYMEKLSEREHIELGQRFLTDFVILAFKIKTEEEVKVRDQYKSPCPMLWIKFSKIHWGSESTSEMASFGHSFSIYHKGFFTLLVISWKVEFQKYLHYLKKILLVFGMSRFLL